MGTYTFWDRVRNWVAGIAFDVFCWAIGLTAEQYITSIVQEGIIGYFQAMGNEPPPLRYWQHGETGRICATILQPSEDWHEITFEQYMEY